MLKDIKIAGKSFHSSAYCIILAFFFIFLTKHSVSAGDYATVKDGKWIVQSTWANHVIAPENINYQDSVLIKNIVDAQDIKINNGGTLIVSKQLDAQSITFNGPGSKLIVEQGAILNVQNLQGNVNNIVYKQTSSPLAVSLVYFTLKNTDRNRNSNQLVWQTAQETNDDYFVVERSLNGTTFTEIGQVKGSNLPNGSTYAFEDLQPYSKTYYRLKQVDFDGKATYSPKILAETNIRLQQNDHTILFGESISGKAVILNSAGQQVYSASLNQATILDLPLFLNGINFLKIEIQGKAVTKRILL